MAIEEPIWWKYVVMKDVDGVGTIKGLEKDTPPEIIEKFKEEMLAMRKEMEEAKETGLKL